MSMTTPEPAGIAGHFTDDGWRDAYALITACLHDDPEGQDAVLKTDGPLSLTAALAAMLHGTVISIVREAGGGDYDVLTPDQRADLAKAILVGGLRGAEVPAPPLPSIVASPAEAAPVPPAADRRREAHATALALIVTVIDADEETANELLRACSPAEVVQVAMNLAEYVVHCCEPEDRAQLRAGTVEQLQSGLLDPPARS
jgi:hypothetical protein